eukprot:5315686-Pleurochrysis_carterae.AAC.1
MGEGRGVGLSRPRGVRACRAVIANTRFTGEIQVDRAALRRVAAELEWGDEDIVAQVGEGGGGNESGLRSDHGAGVPPTGLARPDRGGSQGGGRKFAGGLGVGG